MTGVRSPDKSVSHPLGSTWERRRGQAGQLDQVIDHLELESARSRATYRVPFTLIIVLPGTLVIAVRLTLIKSLETVLGPAVTRGFELENIWKAEAKEDVCVRARARASALNFPEVGTDARFKVKQTNRISMKRFR